MKTYFNVYSISLLIIGCFSILIMFSSMKIEFATQAITGLRACIVNNIKRVQPFLVELLEDSEIRLLTREELYTFRADNKENNPIYISFLGKIYDVTKGSKHYGPSGNYKFFTGVDASRAFVTGDFSPTGLTDDLHGLDKQEYNGILSWIHFYEDQYPFVGKLIGRFYTASGEPTSELQEIMSLIDESVRWNQKSTLEKKISHHAILNGVKKRGLGCGVPNKGKSVHTKHAVITKESSGGVPRDWIGVPRLLFRTGQPIRCVCVQESMSNTDLLKLIQGDEEPNTASLLPYPDCPSDASSCLLDSG